MEKDKIDIYKKIETVRVGLRDNFAQLLGTDNYIEKYLPFLV